MRIKGKRILFITTKNLDYLRNVQEIELLEEENELYVIGYNDKKYIQRLVKIYFKLLFLSCKKYDVIFVGFAPQLILPLFKWKFRGKQIVIDFFISVWDTMVQDRKRIKKDSFLAKLCEWLDIQCIHCADSVISDTKVDGDFFSNRFQVPRSMIHTLYLRPDTNIYYPREQVKPIALKNKFIVLYFGSILPLQGIEVIINAIQILKEEANIHFYIIGPIKDTTRRVYGQNVEYINWLAQDKLAEYISYSDICLAGHFNSDIDKAKRTIPGKAYIYEAMGKPMILGDNLANRELYKEDSMHKFVKMGDAEALAKLILQLFSQWREENYAENSKSN